MKITYHKNPCWTRVELDDTEKELLWWKIKAKEMEELLGTASYYLEYRAETMKPCPARPEGLTPEGLLDKVLKEYLDTDYIYGTKDNEKSKLDKRVDELHQYYLDELLTGHLGDCVCFPASCSKCQAEGLLGIDTIPGIGKHALNKIDSAFGRLNDKSLDEAIESLSNYEPAPYSNEGSNPNWTKAHHDSHLPRWRAEGQEAYKWLVNYRNTHFKD